MQIRESSAGKSPYSWSGPCVMDLIRREGLRNGIFQGYSSVLLRENLSNPTVVQFLAGGTAGVVQWLPPIYCADVIKSRMQTAEKGFYTGVWDCVKKLHTEYGMAVFFRGLSPAIMRAFPLHAIIFVGYEATMEWLNKE
eukprot:gene41731-51714_t